MIDLDEINSKIHAAIFDYNMLLHVKNVVIGVSGGSDSMTLLKFFMENRNMYSLDKLIVAHVNHCLRGKESDRDEKFVRDFCKKNDVKLEVLKVDVKSRAKDLGLCIEECARNVRYKFFLELAYKYNAMISTAHTLSDSVETILINLTRGTGLAGLCGITPKRDRILRPLIYLKKEDTVNFCIKNKISYVIDSTNLDKNYIRNKLRLEVIPVLKQINGGFENTIYRMTKLLDDDEKYLSSVANSAFIKSRLGNKKYDLRVLSDLPMPILSRCIKYAIFEFSKNKIKINFTSRHINLIYNLIHNKNNGVVILPNRIKVIINDNILMLEKELISENKILDNKIDFNYNFKVGKISFNYFKTFYVDVLDKNKIEEFCKNNKLLFFYILDYDTISVNTVFRNKKAGDKFRMPGRGITKTVKKLFNELKIPVEDRSKYLLLANDNNVLWIDIIGVSEVAKVSDSTRKVVIIYSKED